MARWLRDRLLFRSAKPVPPQPDYAAGPAEQPDLLAAYRLQRERDFEDPYAAGGAASTTEAPGPGEGRPCRRRRSPRRRLIRVEAAEGDPPGPQEKMLVLEDYADPFDTRQKGSSPTGEPERMNSEGYMEPYEAQKLLAEIQKKDSQEELASPKPLHLYDIPYESENGSEPNSPRPPGTKCRYSWLPEDDERPPEEYDQPWEWKKERISRVFAVEIEGNRELPWPPPVGQLDSSVNHADADAPPGLQSASPRGVPLNAPSNLQNTTASPEHSANPSSPLDISGQATVKCQLPSCVENSGSPGRLSMEHGLAFGERVNPALPLESQAWYHGTLSRVDAESLLRLCREASYLVRNSESSHDAFSLSLKSSQGFLHMKLLPTEDNRFVLGQHSPPFDNVPEIIHHYASHKLPIQGAEHISLLYPVTAQPSSCLAAEP
uniref:SH2 domain-containing adapter protein F isoform X1 n=1 Tax=Pogona vitticeps TaxID=103695 RepID=A0ABM5EWW9_9SAUR